MLISLITFFISNINTRLLLGWIYFTFLTIELYPVYSDWLLKYENLLKFFPIILRSPLMLIVLMYFLEITTNYRILGLLIILFRILIWNLPLVFFILQSKISELVLMSIWLLFWFITLMESMNWPPISSIRVSFFMFYMKE